MVCYNSELTAFKGVLVGSQYLGMGSIFFAIQGSVETVRAAVLQEQCSTSLSPAINRFLLNSSLDSPLTLKIIDHGHLSLSHCIYMCVCINTTWTTHSWSCCNL